MTTFCGILTGVRLSIRSLVFPLAMAAMIILRTHPAAAELVIDITRGNIDPLPIAVTSFLGEASREAQIGKDISAVLSADLERSGLFRPIPHKAFIQTGTSLAVRPRFGDWRIINAQAMVQGRIEIQDSGKLRIEFRLWDVFAEQQMAGQAYFTVAKNWRRVAHIIADVIYKRMTGESGYFDTRVVYIAESGPANKRIKRLAIMDQDGANHRFLTDGQYLVLTPRFSPTAQEITYLSYIGKEPRVYIFNLDTGRQEILGDFPGMTYAPRFSPDGNKVVMSMAKGGNSEIYVMNLGTRDLDRLTNNPAIDTSPSYSPDSKRITFNSDRGGTQQIYVMDANGDDIQRISFGKGRYATPVWSPRGDYIAFTKMKGGEFFIGIMHPDGSGERQLARGFLVEGPTWAPNGRVLSFFKQGKRDKKGRGGESRLHVIDITGHNEREIVTPLDASDPAWSPLIP